MKEDKKKNSQEKEEKSAKGRDNGTAAVPGINTPGIEVPAFNPPVPNRAWTAMRQGLDIDELSEEQKAELYLGKDELF